MINDELKEAVMGDIVLLSLIGIKVVLVHGGGPEITEIPSCSGVGIAISGAVSVVSVFKESFSIREEYTKNFFIILFLNRSNEI